MSFSLLTFVTLVTTHLVMRIEMATYRHIGEFNSQLEDWCSYIKQLQNYFLANDIKSEAKQQAILLSVNQWPFHLQVHQIITVSRET